MLWLIPVHPWSVVLCPQVAHAAFDLLFAFDEVISLGHKENVTVAQVGGLFHPLLSLGCRLGVPSVAAATQFGSL
jgi:hypothetical protein